MNIKKNKALTTKDTILYTTDSVQNHNYRNKHTSLEKEDNYLLKKYFDEVMTNCETILKNKNKEYSDNRNPFSNFTELAENMNVNPETVWYIYYKKGMMAIENYCKTTTTHSDENIEDRIFDAINYMVILYGLTQIDKKKVTPSPEEPTDSRVSS